MVAEQYDKKDEHISSPAFQKSNKWVLADSCPSIRLGKTSILKFSG